MRGGYFLSYCRGGDDGLREEAIFSCGEERGEQGAEVKCAAIIAVVVV